MLEKNIPKDAHMVNWHLTRPNNICSSAASVVAAQIPLALTGFVALYLNSIPAIFANTLQPFHYFCSMPPHV
jgi:hypothetical protein